MGQIANELVEPITIPDVYADGMEVEDLGVCVRLIMWTWHRGERIVVAKLIRPKDALLDAQAIINAKKPRERPKMAASQIN